MHRRYGVEEKCNTWYVIDRRILSCCNDGRVMGFKYRKGDCCDRDRQLKGALKYQDALNKAYDLEKEKIMSIDYHRAKVLVTTTDLAEESVDSRVIVRGTVIDMMEAIQQLIDLRNPDKIVVSGSIAFKEIFEGKITLGYGTKLLMG